MQNPFILRWAIIPLWLLLTVSVFLRNPIPVDETRYLSVAWEMWLRSDFWVPYLNGQTYSHKPPLLFWLYQLGWAVFGVNQWWPSLVGPICALFNLVLTRKLAKKLWPEDELIALIVPWILIASLLWTLFATAVMFDMLLTNFVLLGMMSLQDIKNGKLKKGFFMLSLAIGLGLLAKGPVIFVYLLPAILFLRSISLLPISFSSLFACLLIGLVIALIWAIPAAFLGGEDYANAIIWRQIADRTIVTDIHVRPLLWYFMFLPLVLFPWSCWPRFWVALSKSKASKDDGLKFCVIWVVSGFLVLSIFQSKQIHYLIPLLPGFALIVAKVMHNTARLEFVKQDLVIPFCLALIGLFLVILPKLSYLGQFHWVLTIQPGWGLTVIANAVILLLVMIYFRTAIIVNISIAMVLSIVIGFKFFFQYIGLAYNLLPAAEKLKSYSKQGLPCAFVGNYQGQLNFLARLTQPLPILKQEKLVSWVDKNPNGCLISIEKLEPHNVTYHQAYREYWLVFREARQYQQLMPL